MQSRSSETSRRPARRPAEPANSAATIDRAAADRAEAAAEAERQAAERAAGRSTAEADRATRSATKADRDDTDTAGAPPAPAGPRPRSSLLATLSLLTAVAAALLVLSGPLAGYGLGLAGVALLFSLGGVAATRRRHVAGTTDALLGTAVALGAIVVGVLALTGSLSWLGTDVDSASRLREWLDAQFANRF